MADESKNDIIANTYHEFYGSQRDTFLQARKQDKSITMEDVKKWFGENFVRKTNLRGFNSFIAQHPHQEYQIDLFFMPESDGEEYQQALMMIDTFSKFMTIIPLKFKQADDVLEGIKKGIQQMGKKPEVIYSDDEGSFNSKQAQEYYEKENITHMITRGHAPVAERAIRTIKNMLYKRMEAKPESNWYDTEILSNSLVTYNYKNKNRMTNHTPNEARKADKTMDVKTNLELHKISKRKYPDIKVGDNVRYYVKRKNFQKERIPVWSQTKHAVTEITEDHGQKFYKVEGYNRPLMRHEVLKL
jgi:hypothetical protein